MPTIGIHSCRVLQLSPHSYKPDLTGFYWEDAPGSKARPHGTLHGRPGQAGRAGAPFDYLVRNDLLR